MGRAGVRIAVFMREERMGESSECLGPVRARRSAPPGTLTLSTYGPSQLIRFIHFHKYVFFF